MGDLLRGRVALVTGSSRGLGREIAFSLADEGADIIICGRNAVNLFAVMREVEKRGVKAHYFVVEATNQFSVRALFRKIVELETKRLDILVNNVGNNETFGNFFNLAAEDWKRAYDLNVMSMMYFTREAIPWLKKSDNARIINISSVPAHQPGLFNPHYSAAKAAMLNLSKHLANILAQDGILVNSICPGTLKGGGWDQNVKDRAEREGISGKEAAQKMEEEEKKKVPLGKIGTLEDVARLVVFLASPQAKFITGECVNVDGGVTRSV